jgi:hypothetical protein
VLFLQLLKSICHFLSSVFLMKGEGRKASFQGLHMLLHRCSISWATPLALCSGYFGDRVSLSFSLSLSRPMWTLTLLFYTSCLNLDIRCTPPHQIFSVEMGSCKRFCQDWPRPIILLMSASHVARITGWAIGSWCVTCSWLTAEVLETGMSSVCLFCSLSAKCLSLEDINTMDYNVPQFNGTLFWLALEINKCS